MNVDAAFDAAWLDVRRHIRREFSTLRREIYGTGPHIGDILDSIKDSLEVWAKRQDKWPVPKHLRKAIRSVGGLITSKEDYEIGPDTQWDPIVCPEKIPAIVVTMHGKHPDFKSRGTDNTERWAETLAGILVQRIDKMPTGVPRERQAVYLQCWLCYDDGNSISWVELFASVCKVTGRVTVQPQLQSFPVVLPSGATYYQRRFGLWGVDDQRGWGRTVKERRQVVARAIAKSIQLWTAKEWQWTIGVRNATDRLTFLIPPGTAKECFADRGIEALTPTGQRRRIMHVVQQHERTTKNGRKKVVAEHLRGIREFDWRGYRCFITSPRHHAYGAHLFTLPSVDASTIRPPSKAIDSHGLARKLSSLEDERQVKIRLKAAQ